MHEQYIYTTENSTTAVLFIHGILESPRQFDDFIQSMGGAVSVYNILLDGHGGNGKEFSQASMKKWEDNAEKAFLSIVDKHDKIFIVGHSMGALLALWLASKYGDRVEKLFLLAVPLYMKLSISGAINGLKVAFTDVKESDVIAYSAKTAYSIGEVRFIDYFGWLPRYMELFSKARQVRKLLKSTVIPIMAVQSRKDEFVSRRSYRLLSKCSNVTAMELIKSGHFYYEKSERTMIIELFTMFFRHNLINAIDLLEIYVIINIRKTNEVQIMKTVIFDMDGLLVDTEWVYDIAARQVIPGMGYEFDDATLKRCIGQNEEGNANELRAFYGEEFDFVKYLAKLTDIFYQYIDEKKVGLKHYVRETLEWFVAHGYKLAVATSNNRTVCNNLLNSVEIKHYFDYIITGEDVHNGKPNPEIFLSACAEIGGTPSQTIVFEDSFNGVRAGRNGGLLTVMIPDVIKPDDEMKELATEIHTSLEQFFKDTTLL